MTVMFCDIVGSTPLSEQLDPEDLREILRSYQEVCTGAVSRFGGHVAKYIGDGLMVYFGYPQAHEDDAIRAAHAGLALVAGMASLNAQLRQGRGIELGVRVGIHTGLVVAGEMGAGETREELAVVGETPNVASRLEGIAEPNTVVVSALTYRLIQGYFECEALGPHALRGISERVDVYRVTRVSDAPSRFEMATGAALTPIVGRDQELGLILDRWEHVKEGMGQVILLSGEPGIGKSRMIQTVKERLAMEPHTLLECQCSTFYQNTALYPVIDLLERWLSFKQDDPAAVRLRKLEAVLAEHNLSSPDVVPLFADLLSVPIDDRYPSITLSPELRREKTLRALVAMLIEVASHQPLLFVVEDLHWVDPTTLELLGLIVDQAPLSRIFVLLTFRQEFRPPWAGGSYLTSLALGHLSQSQGRAMAERVAGDKSLPAELLQELATISDGVPLFVEELTKMVLESELLTEADDHYELAAPLTQLAIPTTLQGSLTSRLDRLTTAKEVTQLAATIGREFRYDLLQAVSPLDEGNLRSELARLVDAEFLYQQGTPPDSRYVFRHALIQESAYQSLLMSNRQQYHRQIANVLEGQFPTVSASQPELLAHHLTEARLSERAIDYWLKAGLRATERSANVEAISHYRKGLDLVETMPENPERPRIELALQLPLGSALTAAHGYVAEETKTAFLRAWELCRQVGQTEEVSCALYGVWSFLYVGCQLEKARELAEEGLRMAEDQDQLMPYLVAHNCLGVTSSSLGDLEMARTHLEKAISLYDPELHRGLVYQCGEDPRYESLSHLSLVLWLLGYPEQAVRRAREAIAWARELSYAQAECYTLNFLSLVAQLNREWRLTEETAQELTALSARQLLPEWVAVGKMNRGSVLIEKGEHQRGIEQILEGLKVWGTNVFSPFFLSILARGYQLAGNADEATKTLDSARQAVTRTGERQWEAELHRLKGEVLLAQSIENMPRAEEMFRKAIAVAQGQNAKSLELRAAISLSRLFQRMDRSDEGLQILKQIYGEFTEGFDYGDLKEAEALIADLS